MWFVGCFGVSGTGFGPAAQDEGLGSRSGPPTGTGGYRLSRPDPKRAVQTSVQKSASRHDADTGWIRRINGNLAIRGKVRRRSEPQT